MPAYVSNLNELTAPAANDYVLVSDTSDAVDRDKKMQLAKMAIKNGTPTAGRLASWTDANFLQDAGFLTTDVVRKTGTPVAGRGVSWVDANTIQDSGYLTADVVRKTGTPTANNITTWNAANIVQDGGIAVSALARKAGTPVLANIASWLDAITLQDGGIAISDLARLGVGQTFTGANIFSALTTIGAIVTPLIYSAAMSMGPDTAYFYGLMQGIVVAYLQAEPNSAIIAAVRATSTPHCTSLAMGSASAVRTGVLTGTTGVAGQFTVSADVTGLYIENRRGNTRLMRVLILG